MQGGRECSVDKAVSKQLETQLGSNWEAKNHLNCAIFLTKIEWNLR